MPFLSYIYPAINKQTENNPVSTPTPTPTPKPAPIVKKIIKTKEDYNNDFEKYYSKRYTEEMKPYTDRPSLSLSYMIFMASFPKTIREKSKKEWDSYRLV